MIEKAAFLAEYESLNISGTSGWYTYYIVNMVVESYLVKC